MAYVNGYVLYNMLYLYNIFNEMKCTQHFKVIIILNGLRFMSMPSNESIGDKTKASSKRHNSCHLCHQMNGRRILKILDSSEEQRVQ